MRRFALIVAMVVGFLGLVGVDAKTDESSPSEAIAVTDAGPLAGMLPLNALSATGDATLATDATAEDPQEPAPDYWAENRPPAGTARSLPTRLFPANNWWNLIVAQAPVDPKSAAFIESIKLGGDPKLRYDWGNNYGLPYVTVSGNYPKVRFQGCSYWNETDQIAYPIPVPALTEPGWTEDLQGTIDNPVSTGDRHLLIVDVDNQHLYEIYQPYHNATGNPVTMPNGTVLQPGAFYCAGAAFWDMKTNDTRPDGWTSSDAAGLQVLPGLVQYDEVMGPDPITHAHRITLNWSSSQSPLYVWPATHSAGSYSATNPPLGTRLRLKASKDLSFAGPHARKVLQAMKDYGVIFADNGGHGMITGTNDARWGDYESPIRVEFASAFSQVSLSDFEVIQLGWKPETVPTEVTITWPTPAPIVQGKPLGSEELAAAADVPGTFAYDPPAGTVLPVGVHTLTAVFTPDASTLSSSAAAGAAQPAATNLEAEASSVVHGPMVEAPDTAATGASGPQQLDPAIEPVVTSVSLVVLEPPRTTPILDWKTPSAIVQGTALSSAQLNASTTVPGTFAYTPGAGTVLAAGTHTLSAVFTPADATLYYSATAYTALTVNPPPKTTPVITWPAPAAITQGTALSGTQLNAASSVPGSFVYTPAAGTVLAAGTHTLATVFTPADATLYHSATAYTALTVNPPPKTTPVITWPAPAAITQGTALSGTQLNAASSVPGSFVYTPAAGTVLAAGTHTLATVFTPSDRARYDSATASTSLTVNAARNTLVVRRPTGGVVKSSGINCGSKSNACSVTKPAGVWLGLLATADRGYVFTGWTDDCSGTEASYALALTGPRTCGATFAVSK